MTRVLLVLALTLTVPFQAALAVTGGQCLALEHHHSSHDGHDGHQHNSGTHCDPCCGAAAIAGPVNLVAASADHCSVAAVPDLSPLSYLPGGVDRPPRSL